MHHASSSGLSLKACDDRCPPMKPGRGDGAICRLIRLFYHLCIRCIPCWLPPAHAPAASHYYWLPAALPKRCHTPTIWGSEKNQVLSTKEWNNPRDRHHIASRFSLFRIRFSLLCNPPSPGGQHLLPRRQILRQCGTFTQSVERQSPCPKGFSICTILPRKGGTFCSDKSTLAQILSAWSNTIS